MRPKLLKKVLRRGEVAFGVSAGVSAGIMVGRLVLNHVSKKMEKEAERLQQTGSLMDPRMQKRLKAMRVVRTILHFL